MGCCPLKGVPVECSETGTSLVGSLGNSLAGCWSLDRDVFGEWVVGPGSGIQVPRFFKPASAVSSKKAMAPHSSTLAWKIPWTEEPGRLQSMGSLELDMIE